MTKFILQPASALVLAALVSGCAGTAPPAVSGQPTPSPSSASTAKAAPTPAASPSTTVAPSPVTAKPTPLPGPSLTDGMVLSDCPFDPTEATQVTVLGPGADAEHRTFFPPAGVQGACSLTSSWEVTRMTFNADVTELAATQQLGQNFVVGTIDDYGSFTSLSDRGQSGFTSMHVDTDPLFNPVDDRLWFLRDHAAFWSVGTDGGAPRQEMDAGQVRGFGMTTDLSSSWQFTPFGEVVVRPTMDGAVGMPGSQEAMRRDQWGWYLEHGPDDGTRFALGSTTTPTVWLDEHRLLASDGSQFYLDTFSADRTSDTLVPLLPPTTGRFNRGMVVHPDGDSYIFLSGAGGASDQEIYLSHLSTPGAAPQLLGTSPTVAIVGWVGGAASPSGTTPATIGAGI